MSPQLSQRSLVFPLLMVVAGLALIIGSIWWTLNAQSAQDAVFVGQNAGNTNLPNNPPAPAATRRIPFANIKRVGVADAKAALDLKQAVFIDTRGEPFYSEGHIPGALSMMENELDALMGTLDKNAWIITYCT